jgi:hypothetical protein
MPNDPPAPAKPALQCDCVSWATSDAMASLCGNGHHVACPHFVPTVGAVELLKQLATGIKWWADQEDGVPDELWEPYKKAVFITTGRMISDEH